MKDVKMPLAKPEDIVERSAEITDKFFEGTQFASDPESRELVSELKNDLAAILSTDEGRRLTEHVEKLGRKVTTEKKFLDAIKIIFRIVRQLPGSSLVKFGLFVLATGALIAVVAALSFVGEASLAAWILRLILWIGGALIAALPTIVRGIEIFQRALTALFWKHEELPAPPAATDAPLSV